MVRSWCHILESMGALGPGEASSLVAMQGNLHFMLTGAATGTLG